jgi:hypothetical protein
VVTAEGRSQRVGWIIRPNLRGIGVFVRRGEAHEKEGRQRQRERRLILRAEIF